MTTTVDIPPAAAQPRSRRALGWAAIGLVLLLAGGAGAALVGIGQYSARVVLDPASAGPGGTRALVSILRDQGITVDIRDDRAGAIDALTATDATLVLPDTPALSDDAVEDLAAAASDVVLIDPTRRTLRVLLGDGVEPAGLGGGTAVSPGCDLAEAERAGDVAPGLVFTAGDGATECYPVGEAAGLIVVDDGTQRLSAVDATAVFANEHLADNGNAALALNLLGRHPLVVWYTPSLDDTDLPAGAPTLGELTPPWVTPAIVVLLAAGLAAALWRGRRFGPLVAERLPVTVRAAETTEGRARLYARSRDAAHAAAQLRARTVASIGALLGLGAVPGGATAGARAVADQAAALLGADRARVHAVLVDTVPRTDADLVALADDLHDLEAAVRRAVRPERTRS